MQQYILILLGVLVILLIGVIYFGWRKLINLEIEASRNKYDIEALRSLLSKILEGDEPPTFQELQSLQGRQMNNAQQLEKMQTQINSPFQQQFPVQNRNVPEQKFEQNFEEESLESDVDTLESTEDKVPEDEESSVSIESLGSTDEDGEDASEESESEIESEDETEELESEEEEDSDDEAQKLIESELAAEDAEEEIKDVNGEKGDEPDEKNEEETVEEDVKNVQVGDIKKRNKKVPNEAAKDFRVGYRMKSTNDGNTYEVVKNGNRKSWKLV